jgi:hypothetical protein
VLVDDRVCVTSKVFDTWHITCGGEWYFRVLNIRCKSHLLFCVKAFLWHAMIGGLPLAMTYNATCILCTTIDKEIICTSLYLVMLLKVYE